MPRFKKYETGENFSMQIQLEQYLASDHLSKKIEAIVSELDLDCIESSYSNRGQRGFHPKMVLCILFYGYAIGIRSGRKLASACKENLAFIYLSRGYQPTKSVINDFRKDHYHHFANLFNQVLAKCQDKQLGDPSISIIDGSKMRASSSKKRTKTQEQFEKWKKHLLADIADIEEELAQEASSNDSKKKTLNHKKTLVKKIDQVIDRFTKDQSITNINLTDSDGPIMKGKKGDFDTNYNPQAACSEDQIITFCDVVVAGNDKAQLIPALEGIVKNTGKSIEKALADADYGTFDSFEYMDGNQIEGYVPYRDMNTTFEDQPFHSAHFVYDPSKDTYTCPLGKSLAFYRTSEDKKRNQSYRNYRSDACIKCPFKNQCCKKGTARRVIKRETRQGLRDKMKQRLNTEQGQKIYLRRLHPIESFFGHLKYNLKYTHFSLRGLQKVKAEFTMMCIAYNLAKLANHLTYFLSLIWTILALSKQKIDFPDLSMNFFKTLTDQTILICNNCWGYSRSTCTASLLLRASVGIKTIS